MPKKKLPPNLKLSPEQLRNAWAGPLIAEVETPSMDGEDNRITAKQTEQKKKAPPRESVTPEFALENFVQSSCFGQYLIDAYTGEETVVELSVFRMASGWFWTCHKEKPDDAGIYLALPKIPDYLYKMLLASCDGNKWQVGFKYHRHSILEPYRNILRAALAEHKQSA